MTEKVGGFLRRWEERSGAAHSVTRGHSGRLEELRAVSSGDVLSVAAA